VSANLQQHDKFVAYCRQLLPAMLQSRLVNLGWLVLSLLAGTDSHLSSLAEVIPLAATDLSLEQRLRRWLKNGAIDVRACYAPFVKASLQSFNAATVYVVLDSTQYGAGCRALVVGLAYAGQVLPLGWRVIKGRKGHTDPDLQNELLKEIRPYLPPGQVVLVADSEFCAVELLTALQDWGWQFIVRVRGNVYLQPRQSAAFTLSQARLASGQTRVWRDVRWTQKHAFGSLLAIATWQVGEPEPLYVLTNTHNSQAALLVYTWRFWIEPLFGDYKGRGFRLGLSRLRDPERLSRLLLAASLAFLWSLSLGSHIFHTGKQRLVDRNDRSDRSLFQLGYRFIKRCWKLAQLPDILFLLCADWFPVSLTLSTVR
jgi:hypothetical protein